MKKIILSLFFFLCATILFSKNDSTRFKIKKVYVSWGYTRAWYSRSTIHFKDLSDKYHGVTGLNNYYDFTIHNVHASDLPDYDKIYKSAINITIPQFVVRLGIPINDKWDFEINYDHAKYVVDDWQKVAITGQIFHHPVSGDTTLNPHKFLHFEHTDGANFWMFNAVRKFSFYHPSKKFSATWVVKPGGGFVYPRTDVTLFGERLNNAWHISGWIVGVESGLRLQFLGRGFFEFVGKGVYADYMKCLVLGKGNGTASQAFFAAQLTATLGFMFGKI